MLHVGNVMQIGWVIREFLFVATSPLAYKFVQYNISLIGRSESTCSRVLVKEFWVEQNSLSCIDLNQCTLNIRIWWFSRVAWISCCPINVKFYVG